MQISMNLIVLADIVVEPVDNVLDHVLNLFVERSYEEIERLFWQYADKVLLKIIYKVSYLKK
jgi:hypothetical protein